MRLTRLSALVGIQIGTVFLLLFLPDSNPAFFIGALNSTLCALWILLNLVRYPQSARFCWIFAFNLLFGYGAGALNTMLRLDRDFGISASQYFHYPLSLLSSALCLVISVSCALMICGGTLERPIFTNSGNMRIHSDNRGVEWMLFFLIILLVAYAGGAIGYAGVSHLDGNTTRVSPLAMLAGMINPILLALSGYYCVATKIFSLNYRVLFAIIFIISLLLLLPQGRRTFVVSLLPLAMAVILANPSFRKISARSIVWIFLAAGLVWFSVTFFFALRQATFTLGFNASLIDRMDLALTSLDDRSGADLSTKLSDNLRDRTFVLGYVSDLIAANHSHEPLYGEGFFHAVLMVIPSVIANLFFNKDRYLSATGDEEMVLLARLGLPLPDVATTPITTGFGDFHIFGAIAYPLFLALAYSIANRLLSNYFKNNSFLSLFIPFALTRAMFSLEQGIAYYLVALRDLMLLVLMIGVTTWIVDHFRLGAWRQKTPAPLKKGGIVSSIPSHKKAAS